MESKINIQKPLTTEEKIKIYSIYYGTDTNTNLSLEKKFELLKKIPFSSFVLPFSSMAIFLV